MIVKRISTATVIVALLVNLTGFVLPFWSPLAVTAADNALTVDPEAVSAGGAIAVAAQGFQAGESVAATLVTPFGQALGLAPDATKPATYSAGAPVSKQAGATLTAGKDGAIAFTLLTAPNYQTGAWTIVLQGATSGTKAQAAFTLSAPATPSAQAATPVAPTAAPTSPATATAPPVTAVPPTATVAAPAVTATPTKSAANATPTAQATPAATGTPVPARATPQMTGTAATPHAATPAAGTPATSATPGHGATPAPSTPTAGVTATPSPAPSPSPTATPSPTPSPALPYDPNIPAGPLTMPGDGPLLDASGDWRTAVTTEALKHLGVPYIWGGATPDGWDCSGFVQWVFSHAAGVNLPRVAGDQAGVGINVNLEALRPGDLVFFANTYAPGISHVGIYLGNGQFVHAANPGAKTTVSNLSDPYYVQHFAGARQPVAESNGAAPAIPMPDGPALAPTQLLPVFDRAAQLTGVPKEVLLGIARVESGFDARAIGPYLPQFSGTEDEHALGMMQFLPSTYRPYAAQVDAITGKNLGITGIWDGESAIYAAALYLRDNGALGDLHGAIFAYNHADWYVSLVLAWANNYASGTIADPTLFNPGTNLPLTGVTVALGSVTLGFTPPAPSNADTVTVAVAVREAADTWREIGVYVNTARDGSANGEWQPIGTITGGQGQVNWNTAPLADGTYRVMFALTDATGSRASYGLTDDTAVRYTIQRGEPRGSAIINPRADLAYLAAFDGSVLAQIGPRAPVVSGPLRFVTAQPITSATIGSATTAGALTGGTADGRIRSTPGLLVEEGTTNLVTNPSFERGAGGWSVRNTPGGALTVTGLNGGVFGKHALQLDNHAGAGPGVFFTQAGDGNTATWSVYARADGAGASSGFTLAMSGGEPHSFALSSIWQRFSITGASGAAGDERQVIVPPGTVIDIDAAQLEAKPYATSYADGSLGPGYGWASTPDASVSGRLAVTVQTPLAGLTSADQGTLTFWATPQETAGADARLLVVGANLLTLALDGKTATLRAGATVVGNVPWEPGATHQYAITWDHGSVAFYQDDRLAGQVAVDGFALPADTALFLGGDPAGEHAANATVQELAVWNKALSSPTVAAQAGNGHFVQRGAERVITLTVRVALATQGFTPAATKMQFSFDAQHWSDPEPF
ncbi:MAG: NlpC/P60 family protein, partial [Thermomicrobiales bacterium]